MVLFPRFRFIRMSLCLKVAFSHCTIKSSIRWLHKVQTVSFFHKCHLLRFTVQMNNNVEKPESCQICFTFIDLFAMKCSLFSLSYKRKTVCAFNSSSELHHFGNAPRERGSVGACLTHGSQGPGFKAAHH